jgi:hypothetical protein
VFLPASTRSVPPGIHFALLVHVGATFSQTWQYFSQQLMKHDWT